MQETAGGTEAAEPVRVLLAGLDRLPQTILDTLLRATAGIEVVGEASTDPDALISAPESDGARAFLEQLYELEPDVLVLGVRGTLELERLRGLLATPTLLLAVRGKRLIYARVEPELHEVEEVSAEHLLSLIKGVGSR